MKLVDTDWGKVAIYERANLDCISATIAGGQFWDGPLLLPFYDRWSSPRKLAIEIGAFNGLGALYLAKRNKHVIAVEPVHDALLRATLAANGIVNVTPLAGAAYSEGCWMLPAADEKQGQKVQGVRAEDIDNPGGVALVRASKDDAEREDCIQGFMLDKWVEEGEDVGLIKCDAQGCDLRALVGLKKTIERCRPAILFEFEKELAELQGDTWQSYTEFFHEMGYLMEEQDKIGYARNFVAVPL